jgi:peptidoglycan/LPS O-acetylase OafA/YrhL
MRRERELTHHMAAPTTSSSPQPAVKPSRPAGYLPTLDGWRTIAILFVMFCHDSVHHLGPFSTAWLYEHGNLGVDVFFAISGILICSRLLTEEDSQGFISRRSFYIRRAFRILPPAALFLATLLVLKATVHLPVQLPEVLASFFFLRNYTFTFSHFQTIYPFYTSHFWSLAVEEHFYFLLPSLLVFTPKKWRAPLLLILASAISLHRIAPNSWLSFHSDMRLDALLVPAAFAVLLRSPLLTQPNHRRRLIQALGFWPLIAIALLMPVTYNLIPRTTGLLIAWLMPLIILGTMLRPQSGFSRLLENPLLRYIGRISYSLYLWQQLFLISHFGARTARLGVLQSSPLNWLLTFACAMLSYYLIERPLIRLGHHLAPNVAANQVDRAIEA